MMDLETTLIRVLSSGIGCQVTRTASTRHGKSISEMDLLRQVCCSLTETDLEVAN